MGKSPGFWFFTGDWLKDPELRFCSIFARGLLVDLLCYMFEANEIGYLSKPDGTPRPNEQVVDAISGGDREEKLAALEELERSGVLSRDSRGVLYSRRLAKLGEISKARSKAGSKGGSKTKAKPKQNDKQNRGVSDSVSDSDSDTFTKYKDTREMSSHWKEGEFQRAWFAWLSHVAERSGPASESTEQQWLFRLADFDTPEAIEVVRFSIEKQAKNLILNGDHKASEERKPRGYAGETAKERFERMLPK